MKDRSQGVQSATIRALATYWTSEYDWRKGEARLNALPQFTTFPGEIWASPRSWVQAVYPDLAYFNEAGKGGHLAAWEEPELFATELRAAFRPLRKS